MAPRLTIFTLAPPSLPVLVLDCFRSSGETQRNPFAASPPLPTSQRVREAHCLSRGRCKYARDKTAPWRQKARAFLVYGLCDEAKVQLKLHLITGATARLIVQNVARVFEEKKKDENNEMDETRRGGKRDYK